LIDGVEVRQHLAAKRRDRSIQSRVYNPLDVRQHHVSVEPHELGVKVFRHESDYTSDDRTTQTFYGWKTSATVIVSAANALIAQSCLDHNVALVTNDRDFRHFEEHGLVLL